MHFASLLLRKFGIKSRQVEVILRTCLLTSTTTANERLNIPVINTKSLKSVTSSTTDVRAWIFAVQSLLSSPRCSVQLVSLGVCRTLTAADTSCGASFSTSLAVLLIDCTPVNEERNYILLSHGAILQVISTIMLLVFIVRMLDPRLKWSGFSIY